MAIVLGTMAPEWWPRASILSASWRQRESQLEWLCFETSKPSSSGISPPIRLHPLIPCSSTNRGVGIQIRASWGHSVQTTAEGVPKVTDLVLSCTCTSQSQGGLAQAGGFLTEAPTSAGLFCPEPSLCVCPQVLSLHIQPLHMRWVRKEARLSPFPKRACVCVHKHAHSPLTEEMIHTQVQRLGSEQPAWVKGTEERKQGGDRRLGGSWRTSSHSWTH